MASKTKRAASNVDRAVTELRRLIFSGGLPSGSNHLEADLANRLGMSRTPVREATLILSALGLLEVRPRKGIHILNTSIETVKEIYEVLAQIEGVAAGRAASARYESATLDILGDYTDAMQDAYSSGDHSQWFRAEDGFRSELNRLGRNKSASEIVKRLNDQLRPVRYVALQAAPLPYRQVEGSRKIARAVKDHDAKLARALYEIYLDQSCERLVDAMDRQEKTARS